MCVMNTWQLSLLALPGAAFLLGLADLQPPSAKAPTYGKDVAPILYRRCVSCHSDSGVAPFSLISYKNAKARAETIAKVTELNYMPPWKAKADYGEFRDVAALTPQEKDVLARWANAGSPEGNPAEAPAPPTMTPGWRLGPPDLIIKPSKATRIPAEGPDFFRDYLFDPQITTPTWVRAVDFRPDHKGTVHHIIPSLVSKEDVEKLRKIKYDHEDDSWEQNSIGDIKPYNTLGFWSTGAPPFVSPDGTAFLINPGDCFLLDLHYKSKGKPESEQVQVAMYYANKPPKDEMSVNVIANGDIYVQPGETTRAYAIGKKMKTDTTIYAVWPHMHYLGRTIKAWVKFPGGYSKPLVAIDDWDPEWQLLYYLKTPMKVPAGSKVYVTATYDNSANNPRNPNSPPRVVEGGESSKDEMLFFELFEVVPKDLEKKPKAP